MNNKIRNMKYLDDYLKGDDSSVKSFINDKSGIDENITFKSVVMMAHGYPDTLTRDQIDKIPINSYIDENGDLITTINY